MAKTSYKFNTSLTLNPEKGGGWLAMVEITNVDNMASTYRDTSAWKNPSAAKKWVKAKVQEKTPRKNVKFIQATVNEAGKPTSFKGELEYKA